MQKEEVLPIFMLLPSSIFCPFYFLPSLSSDRPRKTPGTDSDAAALHKLQFMSS